MDASLLPLPPECHTDPDCLLLTRLRAAPDLLTALSVETGPELSLQSKYRREYADDLVRMAILMRDLRRQAQGKFTRAGQMWFDRVGLEQATMEAVARHKSARFPVDAEVWDLCSGIGGDTLALAGQRAVVAVDACPAACLRTRWNAAVYDVVGRVTVRRADVQSMELPRGFVHIDPDRRSGKIQRALRLEDYVPGLEFLQTLMSACRGGAIKVGPASNFGGKFPGQEIELISVQGECKEATVWFGELAGPEPYRATVLPAGETLAGHPLSAAVEVTPLQTYLYDPDPAVVRAGLVDLCAERLGLSRLDAAEEYLTAGSLVSSPFVTPFRVLNELPNNERELRACLRNRPAGSYEIKCRHVRVSAETLRRHLPRSGTDQRTIVVARLNGKARMIVAERV